MALISSKLLITQVIMIQHMTVCGRSTHTELAECHATIQILGGGGGGGGGSWVSLGGGGGGKLGEFGGGGGGGGVELRSTQI